MIVVAGIPTEPPVEEVVDALYEQGADVLVLSQRRLGETDLAFSVDADGRVDGLLRVGRRFVALGQVTGVYARLMDHRYLPEVRSLDAAEAGRWAALSDELATWLDVCPGRVVNRPAAMASNGSKPYQAQLVARHGFRVPETLVTNDPDLVRDFAARRERVVYKSVSGVRSVVQTLVPADLDRLEQVRVCPVQFQEWVPGLDVRVHVVGSGAAAEVFATAVESAATDYRYAMSQVSEPARLRAYDLDGTTATRCVAVAADLGLDFAGIDLKVTPDGRWYCFEVNPSPAYTYFAGQTRQPVAQAVARHLAGAG